MSPDTKQDPAEGAHTIELANRKSLISSGHSVALDF